MWFVEVACAADHKRTHLRAEGLNRLQRRQLAALAAAQKARDADATRAASQMAAAIKGGGGGGASWGMDSEDWGSGDGAGDAGGPTDWRKWVAKNTPTEKQEKLLDRIRCAWWCFAAPTFWGCTGLYGLRRVAVT